MNALTIRSAIGAAISFAAMLLSLGCENVVAEEPFKPEPGFELLLRGADLTGWKTKDGQALDGKTSAYGGRFAMKEGLLVIDPAVKGDVWIYTQGELGKDTAVRFDFLPGAGCNNDLTLHGAKFDLKKADIKNLKEGEWNSLEIIVSGDKVEFKCNGESVRTVAAKTASSPLGLRAEFGPLQLRNLRAKRGS